MDRGCASHFPGCRAERGRGLLHGLHGDVARGPGPLGGGQGEARLHQGTTVGRPGVAGGAQRPCETAGGGPREQCQVGTNAKWERSVVQDVVVMITVCVRTAWRAVKTIRQLIHCGLANHVPLRQRVSNARVLVVVAKTVAGESAS